MLPQVTVIVHTLCRQPRCLY